MIAFYIFVIFAMVLIIFLILLLVNTKLSDDRFSNVIKSHGKKLNKSFKIKRIDYYDKKSIIRIYPKNVVFYPIFTNSNPSQKNERRINNSEDSVKSITIDSGKDNKGNGGNIISKNISVIIQNVNKEKESEIESINLANLKKNIIEKESEIESINLANLKNIKSDSIDPSNLKNIIEENYIESINPSIMLIESFNPSNLIIEKESKIESINPANLKNIFAKKSEKENESINLINLKNKIEKESQSINLDNLKIKLKKKVKLIVLEFQLIIKLVKSIVKML